MQDVYFYAWSEPPEMIRAGAQFQNSLAIDAGQPVFV